MMGLHKLTAGDGYTYLTRQVAAADSTERGAASLAEYYSEKGESPGHWTGSGLAGLETIGAGEQVSEAHMKALFGDGLHPEADTMYAERFAAELAGGASMKNAERAASAAIKLGRAFKIDNGASDYRVACAKAFVEHNLVADEKWNAPIEPEARATIRTRVATEMFGREYGRAPADARELSGWVAKSGRQNTKAVAGFDLTFTPVKSVSALWAVAPREISQEIELAHESAIAAALEYLEEHACFTRLGNGGVAQVDANGLIAAAFTHRDSRAGDPNLHTHVAISNKVSTTLPDGTIKWLALDGAALYRNNVPASEVYNTALEAQLRERIGVEFAERPSVDRSKRPVREITGLDTRLAERWSSRSAAITVRTAELAREFQAEHYREPTAIEAIRLAQRATLETRQAKHEPLSHAEQRGGWRAEAIEVLGSPKAVSKMVAAVTGRTRTRASVDIDDPRWIDYTAAEVVEVVSRARSRYQRHNIRAEAIRRVRTVNPPADRITDLVEAITDRACSTELAVTLGDELGDDVAADLAPEVMRRRDGRDVHTRHEATLFTTTDVLDAEARIVALAQRNDGVAVADEHVEMALLEAAANGRELNAGQRSLVRAMATSGAKLQLALAPAGTGKTTAMTALTRSWQNAGGHVVGFAPTAAAAKVLRQDILTITDTLAKFVDITQRLRDGKSVAVPEWYSAIGENTLVIVDEAGMTGTLDLDEAVTALAQRGATVRLIGDDQQLASVASGGVLRDIHDRVGALTLSQVVRFRDTATGAAEGTASLALRDGDDAAIGFYIDHSRLHVGSIAAVTDDAYTAWASDRDAGKDALLLAPTRELVAELNTRARTDRLAAAAASAAAAADGGVGDGGVGREAVLADGLRASAGDIVRTRSNDRRNTISKTDWVRNGDRWIVEDVGEDGSLVVRHLELGRTVTLAPDYVQDSTELGYAGTVHSAQGSTADTCRVVATGEETRQLAYVALTRGRLANHMYLATASDGDVHTAMTERGMLPPTAVDDFRAILRRDGAQVSAHSTLTAADDPHAHLAQFANAYDYSVATGAEVFLGPKKMAQIDAAAEAEVAGLTDESAWPVLRGHLAIVGAHGRDPVEALRAAVRSRELGTADDKAAVLDWRLDTSGNHSSGRGPLPWLPSIPAALRGDAGKGEDAGKREDAEWGAYLDARTDTVAALRDRVDADVRSWSPATAQLWARAFFGAEEPNFDLLSDLAVFRAAHGVDPDDRRPTGPMQLAAASLKAQRKLDKRAEKVLGGAHTASTLWRAFVDELDTHIARDPYFPVLADRLSAAARAGIDVHALVRDSLAASPLPDELPAAALWWRLSGELSAAALDTDTADGSALAPSWTPMLTELLGDKAATRVMSDPSWPALVATVDAADPSMWTPGQLLGTAYEFLHGGIDPVDHGVTFPAHELATALTWRAEMLVRENHLARTYVGPDIEHLAAEDEEAFAPIDEVAADSSVDVLPAEWADPANRPPPVNARTDAAPGDAASPSIPVETDADYLASLDGLDAPVEYDDAPPPEYDGYNDDTAPEALEPGALEPGALEPNALEANAVESDADTDVDPYEAMLEHARVLVLPYPSVTADERVRLLTADLDAAKAEHRGLRAQIADGTSPTVLNAAAMLDELADRADRQRPARIAMLDARHDWMDTAFEAEALWHRIDTVVRPAVAADVAAAGDDEDARALAGRGLDWEIWRAGFADDAATAARNRAQEAAAEYERVAAADGGEVTTVDVITARGTVESIDLAALAELQQEVDRLDGMLLRAEHAARRIAMTTTTAAPSQTTVDVVDAAASDAAVEQLDQSTTVQTEVQAQTSVVAAEATQHDPDPEPALSPADAALLAKMEQDPIRLVPDAELIAFVDRAGRSRTAPTVAADTEKLYARFTEQAAAIVAARELGSELRRIRSEHETARSEHSALTDRLATAKRRERKSIEPAVDHARLREERLARQVRDTQRAASDAAGRVQAETSEWPAIVQRASDPDRRAADLAAAAVFDTAITERSRRLRAVTLSGERHAAEQRIRADAGIARLVEASPIEGVTDTANRRTVDAKPVDLDARKNIARLLADVPGPGRSHRPTQAQHPVQQPDSVVTERKHDNDHGL